MTEKPSMEEIEAAIAAAGSIRKAAPILGVDERTIRRWLAAANRQDEDPGEALSPMRILGIDIETRPNMAYVWDIWNQNISLAQLIESVEMMCFAAKWIGEDEETVFYSEHHSGKDTMIGAAHRLMHEADVVVHYNGQKFDVPHLNREFAQAGLSAAAPFKQVDLLRIVKKKFRFPSNKLAYVAPALGLEHKVSHEGWGLWLSCMAGDEDAWARMRDYNIQDVELLEQLYYRLRDGGWIDGHPSHSVMLPGRDVCPTCASDDLRPDGLAYLRTGQYPRYRCGNCGSYSRDTKRTGGTQITAVSA